MTSKSYKAPFSFSLPPLPRTIYTLLQTIRKKEDLSQWAVVVAGILALRHLKHAHPEEVEQVWEEARAAIQRGQ